MDGALLRAGAGAPLEADAAFVQRLVQGGDAAVAHVLERLVQTLHQVGDVLREGAFVQHRAGDALRHRVRLVAVRHIALGAGLPQGLHGGHASIALHADAILVKVLARRLLRAGEEVAHHHRAGA